MFYQFSLMKSLNEKSQILECSSFLIIFVILNMNTELKNECTKLSCRILEIKALAKELDEED